MHQYRFTILGQDVQPVNLNGFTKILDVSDGRIRKIDYSGTLQFEDALVTLINANSFSVLANKICVQYPVTIEYRENPHDAWSDFGDAYINLESIEADRESGLISVSMTGTDNIKKIIENSNTEFTIDRSEGEYLTMFEYESGTEYTTTKLFYNVATVIDQLLSKMGTGSTLTGDIFTDQYQPQIKTVEFNALAEGDVQNVRIAAFEETIIEVDLTVPAGGYTADEVAEEIHKLILYSTSATEKTALKTLYGINVTRSFDTLTVTDYLGADALITVRKNGAADVTINQTQIQLYQFGLADLYISAKGMKDTDLEISWRDLWDWLWKQFNLGLEAQSDTEIRIDKHLDIIGGTAATVDFEDILQYKHKIDLELAKPTVALGSKFKIAGYDKSQEDWTWVEPETDHIYVGLVSSQTYDFNQVPDELVFDDETTPFSDVGGRWGGISYGAGRALTVQFQIDLNIQADNAASESGNYIEVHINGLLHETLNIEAISSSIPTPVRKTTSVLCLASSDLVVFKIGNSEPTWSVTIEPSYGSLNPVTSVTTIIQPSCDTMPEANEEEYETTGKIVEQYDLRFCSGQIDRQTNSNIYSGLGYAISQHYQGLQDYENTYFAVLKDSVNPEADSFEVAYYHPADDCDCRDDNFFSHFFYNLPIQVLTTARLHSETLPSDMEIVKYLKEVTYNGTTYNLTETVDKSMSFEPSFKDLELIDFEACISPSELLSIESTFSVGFKKIDSITVDSRYKKVEFELATGNTRFEIKYRKS